MRKIDSCNIQRGGVNSFTLRLLEESVLENVQADLCTAIEETECHRLQLIQFFIDYLHKICGHVVHFRKVFIGLACFTLLFAEDGSEGFNIAVSGLFCKRFSWCGLPLVVRARLG